MIISRKLENKVLNRLQSVVTEIEHGNSKKAVQSIQELAAFIRRYVESGEEEKARARREEESS